MMPEALRERQALPDDFVAGYLQPVATGD